MNPVAARARKAIMIQALVSPVNGGNSGITPTKVPGPGLLVKPRICVGRGFPLCLARFLR
jgi:hypothetical protein